ISHVLYPLMSKFEKHYERNEEIQNVLKQILCKPLIKPRQSHCEFENLCSLCKDKCYNNGLYCLTKCSDCDIYRDKRDKMEIKNNKKTLENNINLKRILKENEKNPYVSTQDRYFEVTITSNDNDLEKLKKTFIFNMVRSNAKTFFPKEKEDFYNNSISYYVSAAVYNIKNNKLHGLIRYLHNSNSRINETKLKNIIKNDQIIIKVKKIKDYNDLKHCVDKENIKIIYKEINGVGSKLIDFLVE